MAQGVEKFGKSKYVKSRHSFFPLKILNDKLPIKFAGERMYVDGF